ncbi:uncharacterized protein LOC131436581 [Malaya genurostris]|uniref:uncharacterized protein LOC131436581 n=1 Tax=Malaya genurostris TaxID=325434 RepID=UPI0026F3EF6E|nr:uncharacterized protein LOC131436581 [Malaya genurostris]
MFVLISVILLLLQTACNCQQSNKFEVTLGCLQFNGDHGYNHRHPYFPTSGFRHLKTTKNDVTIMRLGVLGNNDGHIRLASVMYPYNSTEMNEIVLSGWANTKTVVRRYTRTAPNKTSNLKVLEEQLSIGMLSPFEPFMFTMAVHPNGLVQLTKDEDTFPFLEFRDPQLSAKYIGFCNFDVPVVYFYDCPLEVDRRVCDGIAFSRK